MLFLVDVLSWESDRLEDIHTNFVSDFWISSGKSKHGKGSGNCSEFSDPQIELIKI